MVLHPHTTSEGDLFRVPGGWIPDQHTSRCRSCDAKIVWCQTSAQRRAPMNPEGTSHFATCPQASIWRRPKRKDTT